MARLAQGNSSCSRQHEALGQNNHRIKQLDRRRNHGMSHFRKPYGLVQAVACVGGLALPGVASAANFTFIAVLNSG
jgi:hypothetical protein